MSLSCAWRKRYFFHHLLMFLIVFDHEMHAQACICWSKYTTINCITSQRKTPHFLSQMLERIINTWLCSILLLDWRIKKSMWKDLFSLSLSLSLFVKSTVLSFKHFHNSSSKMAKFCIIIFSLFYLFGIHQCRTDDIHRIVKLSEQCIAKDKYSFVNPFYGQDLDLVYQFNGESTYYLSLGLR